MEGIMAALMDAYPGLLRRKGGREITLAVVIILSAAIGLSMCTNVSTQTPGFYENSTQWTTWFKGHQIWNHFEVPSIKLDLCFF